MLVLPFPDTTPPKTWFGCRGVMDNPRERESERKREIERERGGVSERERERER